MARELPTHTIRDTQRAASQILPTKLYSTSITLAQYGAPCELKQRTCLQRALYVIIDSKRGELERSSCAQIDNERYMRIV